MTSPSPGPRSSNWIARLIDYPGPLWLVFSVVATLAMFASVVLWGTTLIVGSFLGMPRRWSSPAIRRWNKVVLWLYRIEVVVEGRANDCSYRTLIDGQRQSVPCLVVTNHQSLLDIPAANAALEGELRMVAKKELFSIPLFGYTLRRLDYIPVDRSDRGSGQAAAARIGRHIRSGLSMWVAPEGTRSNGPQMGPFKKGAFAVAIQTQIPILPLLVMNSFEILPKTAWFPRPGGRLIIRILPPIPSAGYAISERGELAQRVFEVMAHELDAWYRDRAEPVRSQKF